MCRPFPCPPHYSRPGWSLARLAEMEHRDGVEQDALEQAVELRPAFARHFGRCSALVWADDRRTQQQKIDAARDLAKSAADGGDSGLAAELRGQRCSIWEMLRKRPRASPPR